MKSILISAVLVASVPAFAQGQKPMPMSANTNAAVFNDIKQTLGSVPSFFRAVSPEALPGAWESMKSLQLNPHTALSGKDKELIGLAVAAQIPCEYCIYFHTQAAKLNGATPREISEAITEAGVMREFSTYLNGTQQDQTSFRADVDRMLRQGQAQMGQGAATGMGGGGQAGTAQGTKPGQMTSTGNATLDDIQQTLGFVPQFMKAIPASALPGAWHEFKQFEMNDQTALPPKVKSLISLGVAAQVPCTYCTYADTKFARAQGASEEEVAEAVGIAANTRHWSTILNGSQIDKAQFRREADTVFANLRKQMAAKPTP